MKMKYLLAFAAVTVYIAFPPYRYYMIGALIGHRILEGRQRYRVVRKNTAQYRRLVGVKASADSGPDSDPRLFSPLL